MDPVIRGKELESLKNNQYFMSAISEMKDALVEQEDNLLRDVTMDETKRLKAMERIAMMRILLKDMLDTLDSYIIEANNANFEVERELAKLK